MTNEDLIAIGFRPMEHFTIANSVTFPLGRNRHLSAGCIGTPNEILWICEVSPDNDRKITDTICLHNWDYDKELKIEKVQGLINLLK